MSRPTWDQYYMAGAIWAAGRADCTRAEVGAMLVSRTHLVQPGYNGLPSGIPGCASAGNCPRGRLTSDECAPDSDYSNCPGRHAEQNAIERMAAASPRDVAGATLYVTRKPCPACWTLIRSAGVTRVVWPEGEWTE